MAAVDTAKYVHSPVLEGAHARFSGRRQHSQPHPRCTSRRRPPGARPRLDAAPPTAPLAARPWLEAASVDSRVRGSPTAARLGGPWLAGELGIALFTCRRRHECGGVAMERAELRSPWRGADVAWMGFHPRPR